MPQKARAAVLAEFTKAESFTDDDIVDIEDDSRWLAPRLRNSTTDPL
jgi:DNA repair protein RAD5